MSDSRLGGEGHHTGYILYSCLISPDEGLRGMPAHLLDALWLTLMVLDASVDSLCIDSLWSTWV
jgi:hypothetical protein